ncbi:hypothetical protein Nepgr_004926 [Nepenthes gracilis]|uniref:Uncharacterized protein n=1 Tax=Nepenthes gracilis TaxID=150966 RepID=A0AAD3XFX6_NEPGR|nr:hypothetical protein Nepgr_004926 [Nepenthes gracilis]
MTDEGKSERGLEFSRNTALLMLNYYLEIGFKGSVLISSSRRLISYNNSTQWVHDDCQGLGKKNLANFLNGVPCF